MEKEKDKETKENEINNAQPLEPMTDQIKIGDLFLQSQWFNVVQLADLATQILKDETISDYLKSYKLKEQNGSANYLA